MQYTDRRDAYFSRGCNFAWLSQKSGPQWLLMIAQTCSDWSDSVARQSLEG